MSLIVVSELPALAIDFATIVLTAISGYFVYRQVTASQRHLKGLLLLVHVFFGVVIILEILRNFLFGSTFMAAYTELGTSVILWDVELLTLVACLVYLRPLGVGLRKSFVLMFHQKSLAAAFTAVTAYIAAVNLYLVISMPYAIITDRSLLGQPVSSTLFNNTFLALTFSVLILFATFPSTLFLLARKKTSNREARAALLLLPMLWIFIGVVLVVFNGFLLSAGIDAAGLGYLLAALSFGISATLFRRASLLSSFFEPTALGLLAPSSAFSKRLGISSPLKKGTYLFEVAPSESYEYAIKDLAIELLSNRRLFYVFTPKASRVYTALSSIQGAKFYILSSSTSYPCATNRPNEMLMPENDLSIILDTLRQLVSSLKDDGAVGIIFDNISDLILTAGIENSDKFLKRAIEITSETNVAAVFLFTQGAHSEAVSGLIQNRFQTHILFDAHGLKLKRGLYESGSSEAPADSEIKISPLTK